MEKVAFYPEWDYHCCGVPFKVGDCIFWRGRAVNDLICDKKIDYEIDFHQYEGTCHIISGVITKIELALKIRAKDEKGETIYVGEKLLQIKSIEDYEYGENYDYDKYSNFGFVITLDVKNVKEYEYKYDDEDE